MTALLRRRGVIDATDEVVSQEDKGVGMTAGYFSAIKKVICTYRHAPHGSDSFIVKTWPPLELLPKDAIGAMFAKDIAGYAFPQNRFYPRPRAHLAGCDPADDRWALVLEDADTFAEHKVHEHEMRLDELLRMIPKLVDVAVAWEGCDGGDRASELDSHGVDLWASDANLATYKAVMPGGAKLFDKMTTLSDSSLVAGRPWDRPGDGPGIAELFSTRLDAFFATAHPRSGSTCTLSHGDLRGDNIFFCDPDERYPDGWLCIDFQLMFRGPVPSDLAYLLSSATVLPEVYAPENMAVILRSFYDQFMAKTMVYKDYTYDQFVNELRTMTMVFFVYVVGMGGAIFRQGAFENTGGTRVELGGQGAREADLAPEELRQRMWWTKFIANIAANFKAFDTYTYLQGLPPSLEGLGEWVELPAHLR